MAKLHKPFLAFPLNTLLFSTIAPSPKNEKSGFYKLKDFQYQNFFFKCFKQTAPTHIICEIHN